MKKQLFLILALAMLAQSDATAMMGHAAVVNGKVVREQNIGLKQNEVAAKLSNFAKAHNLQGSQSSKQYNLEELKALVAPKPGNNIVAIYVSEVAPGVYSAYIFRKSERARFDKNALKDLTQEFKELAKTSKNLIVRTQKGTNAEGSLVALYANPEVEKSGFFAGKPLEVVEIRSK